MKRQKTKIFDRVGKKFNFFQTKGQVGVPTFVKAIGILIVLVAFLFMVPSFRTLLFEAGEKGECQWNVLVSALTRTPGLGFENIPVECKAKYMDVSLKDLQENYAQASLAIKKYNAEQKNPAYNEIRKKFNNPNSEAQLAEWSANKIVADEMVDCWDKVWKGELPLFDSWHKLIDYDRTVILGLTPQQRADAQAKGIPLDSAKMKWYQYAQLWNLRFQEPPTFCVLCSRIKFAEDVRTALPHLKIDSLTEWMIVNAASMSKESYYQYTLSDFLKNIPQSYEYDVAEPVSIIYSRINKHQIGVVSQGLLKFIGLLDSDPVKDRNQVDKISVLPYDKVIMPYNKGGANCHYILD